MFLRKFYINLIVRIVLVLSNMIAVSFIFPDVILNQLVFTFGVLMAVLIFQIVFLVSYIKKTSRLLTKFILAISNSDYTTKFSTDEVETPHKDLNIAFNKMIDQYQFISKEKEKQVFFIEHLLQTIPVGILVFDPEEKISFKNNLSDDFLNISNCNSIDQIKNELPSFYSKMKSIKKMGSYVYESGCSSERKKLSITVKAFKLFNQDQKLILIQDISKEIDAGELEAIQKLMRVLTHEIMNSLTPINSLTETIGMLMHDEKGNPKLVNAFSEKNINDIRESVLAIKDRGVGLDYFVNKFRTLTKLPETIVKEEVLVDELFNSVCKIMKVELENVALEQDIQKEGLQIQIDQALIEQVLINLLANSLTAMENITKPKLILRSFEEGNNILIQVIDNGVGIPDEKLTDIFIPFYSTKEKGSGIGLSLAKQIMSLHGGSISVQSNIGNETIFTLKF